MNSKKICVTKKTSFFIIGFIVIIGLLFLLSQFINTTQFSTSSRASYQKAVSGINCGYSLYEQENFTYKQNVARPVARDGETILNFKNTFSSANSTNGRTKNNSSAFIILSQSDTKCPENTMCSNNTCVSKDSVGSFKESITDPSVKVTLNMSEFKIQSKSELESNPMTNFITDEPFSLFIHKMLLFAGVKGPISLNDFAKIPLEEIQGHKIEVSKVKIYVGIPYMVNVVYPYYLSPTSTYVNIRCGDGAGNGFSYGSSIANVSQAFNPKKSDKNSAREVIDEDKEINASIHAQWFALNNMRPYAYCTYTEDDIGERSIKVNVSYKDMNGTTVNAVTERKIVVESLTNQNPIKKIHSLPQ